MALARPDYGSEGGRRRTISRDKFSGAGKQRTRRAVLWEATAGITIFRPRASSLRRPGPGELFTGASSDKSTPGRRGECGLRPVSMSVCLE